MTIFMNETLREVPATVRGIDLPRRTFFREDNAGREIPYYPSPVDWAGEVLYFLLPDRFSDGLDKSRPVFDCNKPPSNARPPGFLWNKWAEGGGGRWQGGTIKGIQSRLDYLAHLGITAIWVGPIFKQRRHTDEYHGYAIQNFLEVDPHFGTRRDLIDMVVAAHDRGIRVILDVIFNHSGHNWDYADGTVDPPYRGFPAYYEMGPWLDGAGRQVPAIGMDQESGVWPRELQRPENYTRAGKGSLSGDDIEDAHAEMRRTDFDGSMRDFNFDNESTLNDIARCYKYWIALTDIDGMRLDTLKHVSKDTARNFCGSIKEFAANLGKADFFLVGEVAGPDANADKYLDALELNINATLDIGNSRLMLTNVAKGLESPSDYFDFMKPWNPKLGSHRNSSQRHVKILDDHDEISGRKARFSADASNDHQITAAAGLLLFTLGIPCLYYGTEQAFAGPEKSERDQYLPDFGNSDKYLRETMFGAPHPHKHGAEGLPDKTDCLDTSLPGFGAFGTANCCFFNEGHPVYKRIQHLIAVRQKYPSLRYGRQYMRDIRKSGNGFGPAAPGDLIAWSRILDDEEIVCVVNGHGTQSGSAAVMVDRALNAGDAAAFTVIANTAQTAESGRAASHPVGSTVEVRVDGCAYIELKDIGPSEVVILINKL